MGQRSLIVPALPEVPADFLAVAADAVGLPEVTEAVAKVLTEADNYSELFPCSNDHNITLNSYA